jgi:UV DNA damage repair endonuclease
MMKPIVTQIQPRIGWLNTDTDSSGWNIENPSDFLERLEYQIHNSVSNNIKIVSLNLNIPDLDSLLEDLLDSRDALVKHRIQTITNLVSYHQIRLVFCLLRGYMLVHSIEAKRESCVDILNSLGILMDIFSPQQGDILIRVGSAYGNRKNSIALFNSEISKVNKSALDRLAIVNDEEPSLFSVTDILAGIFFQNKIPVSFRTLSQLAHNGGLSMRESFMLCYSTWGEGRKPIFIHAEPTEFLHSKYKSPIATVDVLKHRIPSYGVEFDALIQTSSGVEACIDYYNNWRSLPPIVIPKEEK